MLNWYGNHKIGVLGASNSGKTIFLTSLLWHLYNHDPERFVIGKGAKITDFQISKNPTHDFGFMQHKNTFVQKHCWPDKTFDYAIANCSYVRSDHKMIKRNISFVDIPGERVSDILIWTSKSYTEWVERLHDFWLENPRISEVVESFWDFANDSKTEFKQLVIEFKKAMWSMLDMYCPITPSTYYLGTDGHMLGDKDNSDRDVAIANRPVWEEGDLIPLPHGWLEAHPNDARQLKKMFIDYKKKVLKPLFSEIRSCDNFIFCIDILNILMSGPELLFQTQREFKDFIDTLAPSKFIKWRDFIGRNPSRLAFVATKSDLVASDYKDNMSFLLKEIVEPLERSGINYRHYICSACVSTQIKQSHTGQKQLIGKDRDKPESAILLQCAIPECWPDTWDPYSYCFPEVAPVISSMHPPQQVNLDNIFEFIVEDK
jgi:predicted YcjX-like family ATPase